MAKILDPAKLQTASLYPLATLEERTAGTARVLVTRYWPRGLAAARLDEWWRGFAPTSELLHAYKTGALDWQAFADAYRQQDTPETLAVWRDYAAEIIRRQGGLTLLCFERCPRDGHDESDIRCHRRLLRELLLESAAAEEAKEQE